MRSKRIQSREKTLSKVSESRGTNLEINISKRAEATVDRLRRRLACRESAADTRLIVPIRGIRHTLITRERFVEAARD